MASSADHFLMCYGTELTSGAALDWSDEAGIEWHYIAPGDPMQSAFIESFNAVVRLECLGQHWFLDLDDARKKVEDWRTEYNEVRPHGAIGDRAPMSLIRTPGPDGRAPEAPEALI